MFHLKLYACMLALGLAIDGVWLILAYPLYQQQLGPLLRSSPNWAAVGLFYAIFVLGLLVLAVLPSLQASRGHKAVLLGAMYGLATYATYDLTNLATLHDWPVLLTVVDLLWGTAFTTALSWLSYTLGRRLQ